MTERTNREPQEPSPAESAPASPVESAGHDWTKHEHERWSVCSRCGMVRNYQKETPCRGALPAIALRGPSPAESREDGES